MSAIEKLFPIQLVARRTGLNVDVLRAWERRYGVVAPERSEGGRRLYSAGDIDRLSLLARVVDRGLRIGDARRMSDAALRAFLAEREPSGTAAERAPAPERKSVGGNGGATPAERSESDTAAEDAAAALLAACKKAVEDFDSVGLTRSLARAKVALSLRRLVEGVVAPLLAWIGDRWSEGTICIAQEHMASAVIRAKLLGDVSAGVPSPNAPCIVVTTPALEMHEIGALLAALVAAGAGWRVEYLGPDLPAGEIALAARRCGASAVALSIARPTKSSGVAAELEELRRLLPKRIAILLGGKGAENYAGAATGSGDRHFADCWSLARHLESRVGALG